MCVVVAFLLPLLFMQTYRGFIVSICMCAWYGGVCEVVVNFRIEQFVLIPHVRTFRTTPTIKLYISRAKDIKSLLL